MLLMVLGKFYSWFVNSCNFYNISKCCVIWWPFSVKTMMFFLIPDSYDMNKNLEMFHARSKITYFMYIALCLLVYFVFLSVFMFSNWVLLSNRRIDVGEYGIDKCNSTILSLATFGVRTFKINDTVQSLMKQTMGADLIVVHIALVSRTGNITSRAVYEYLTSTFAACAQSVYTEKEIQCGERLLFYFGLDLGPATKVLGTILRFPDMDQNTCIISVDDDVIYDKRLVQILVANAPQNGALGLSCEEIPFELDFVRIFSPSALWWHVINVDIGWKFPFDRLIECRGWLHGYRGILYRRKSFSSEVFLMDATMPEGCFYADDVRLSGFLWTKGIKRYVFPHFILEGPGDGHLKKNASDALSMMYNSMQYKQWPCVQHFGWD